MSYQDVRGAYYCGSKHGNHRPHKRSILSSMDSIPYVDADGSSAYSGGGTSFMCDTSSSEALDSSGVLYPLHPLARASSRQPLVETDDSSLNNLLDALDALDDRVSAAFSHLESLLPDSTSGDISGASRNSLETKEDVNVEEECGKGASFLDADSGIVPPPREAPLPKVAKLKSNQNNMQDDCANNIAPPSWIKNKESDRNNHCASTAPSSPPFDVGPPAHYISSLRASRRGASPDKDRDPLARLHRFLRVFYRELAGRDHPHPPPWAPPLPVGTLCPAHFQPALQLAPLSGRGENEPRDTIRLDQLLAAVRTSEGVVHEAPRRVLVEGGPGSGKTTLALRLLHSWATQDDPGGYGGWLGPPIQIAFFVPLRELRGSSLAHYLQKELLPKQAVGSKDGFAQIWKCLGLMEEKLLFVLDGYDEAFSREALGDAVDLLEGRLFPESRVIVTSCPGWCGDIYPYLHRRVLLQGMEWSHVEELVNGYFSVKKKPESAGHFLDVVGIERGQSPSLRDLACWPLGWLLLCVLFEEEGGQLPLNHPELYQALFKCLIRRSLLKRGEILTNTDLPGHCKKMLMEFGKLCLACLKEDRYFYTDLEIRTFCRGLEVTDFGFLTRSLNFGRSQKRDYYHPIHKTFSAFLAAYYVTSIVHYANILKRELEELPCIGGVSVTTSASGGATEQDSVLILKFLMGLLGKKGYLVFNQLSPLDFTTRTLFHLLHSAGASEANVASLCKLLGSCGPVLVHTVPLELEGWSYVLQSDSCGLEALELVFQFDKGDCEALDIFFTALSRNDSVRLVRISSLLGHEFTSGEVGRLATYVKTTLPKARLQTFELVITCLEDNPHDRFQTLVDSLCESLEDLASPTLSKLVLDLNLGTSQVVQLCGAIEKASQVSVLHLPHLGCGREGLKAIANLIRTRPLMALNLSGSWGMRRDDPPSSGASVGSGSSSSGGDKLNALQFFMKQTLNNPPSYSPKSCYFSLPRVGVYNSLSRPATLPRQDDKRNSDSILFQKLFHPLPACDSNVHCSGFHDVFEAVREPGCKLRSLNVSKCLLGADDALCLGETVRKSRCLDALRLEGGTKLGEVLPVVVGVAENTSLQLLDLGSPRLILEDGPTQLVCQSLGKNNTLRLLSLDGWTFRIEEEASLSIFLAFLQNTAVRDLVLANCRFDLSIHDGKLSRLGRQDDSVSELLTSLPDFRCPAVVFLRLGGFQVTVNDRITLRGPHLLPFLKGFTRLSDLDLSLDKSQGNPLFVDDKILVTFFQTLAQSFRTLQSLKISNWKMCLEDSEKTLRLVGRSLKACSLSYLKVNNLVVTDNVHRGNLEHLFLQTVISNLNYLSWLSIISVTLSSAQASSVGKCIRDRFSGSTLELSAKNVGNESLKSLVAALEEGGKAEAIFVGGPNCNLRIQKIAKNQKRMGKFRRFTSLKE